ncbi:hypothetical protein [Paenibacillus sp. GCM10027626]|uniref:hypothetical protein n=1 Tax=Paenibacillus sp. GCM10027626 TaxID=3273411 RepID=UPI003629206D
MNSELNNVLKSVIREELEPVKRKLDSLETEQLSITTEMKIMMNEVSSVKQAVLETNQRLQVVESEQKLIKQAVMETNQAVQRLESIQEQQHRIIEMLSVRSIEQEAELRQIK